MSLDQGRFYNAQDQMQRARVAVIGPEVKEKLFSGRNAIGDRIRVDGISFEVIGIYSPKMQEGDNNINRLIFVPFTTMGDLKNTHYLDSIWFNYETRTNSQSAGCGGEVRDQSKVARFRYSCPSIVPAQSPS